MCAYSDFVAEVDESEDRQMVELDEHSCHSNDHCIAHTHQDQCLSPCGSAKWVIFPKYYLIKNQSGDNLPALAVFFLLN